MITKVFLGLVLAGTIFFAGNSAQFDFAPSTAVTLEQNYSAVELEAKSELKSEPIMPKIKPASKTINLEAKNMVVFRGPVTEKSASDIQAQILELSHKLSKNTPIYLVLNTPGGSVGAGLDLIDFMKAIPHKIHTITLFAASMGFQIAQNMNTRYITPNGTLMSHRARLSGLGGQLDGELESRYSMIKRKIDYLDAIAAKRMKMSVKDYKAIVINEYWVHGFDSVDENAADEMVNITCGKSLKGTVTQKFNTMFGTANVELSKCPLIQAPINVSFSNVKDGKRKALNNLFNAGFINKRNYLKNYILTGEHTKIFGL